MIFKRRRGSVLVEMEGKHLTLMEGDTLTIVTPVHINPAEGSKTEVRMDGSFTQHVKIMRINK